MPYTEIVFAVVIVAAIGLIAGIGLSLASKFMAVPVDEKQEKIREALPGANCGACGYSGCDGYAAAVAVGEAEPNKCAAGGETAAKAIADILGVEVVSKPQIAFIHCGGSGEKTANKFLYSGMQSCAAANLLQGGPLECANGCLGFGDCLSICPFGAIEMVNGRPSVNAEICVGCGKCVNTCPKSLISLIPKDAKVVVNCNNTCKGAAVVKACKTSCVACGLCENACEFGAIKVENNIATINYELCTGCGKCKDACKRGIIL